MAMQNQTSARSLAATPDDLQTSIRTIPESVPYLLVTRKNRFPYVFALLLILLWSSLAMCSDAGKEPVYDAGPSTKIVTQFFAEFAKQPESAELGIHFTVPQRSTKHSGGIRASGEHLFGRTGRPLTGDEKSLGKFEITLAKIPVGFVTGSAVSLPPLKPADIEALFSGRIRNWKDLGGPAADVVLVGRERTEATLTALSKHFPLLLDANYDLVLKRDHAVVNFLRSAPGRRAIGYGALANFAGLNLIEVQGVTMGVSVGLVVDVENQGHPVVNAVRRFAGSEQWRRMAENAGYLPVTQSEGVLLSDRFPGE